MAFSSYIKKEQQKSVESQRHIAIDSPDYHDNGKVQEDQAWHEKNARLGSAMRGVRWIFWYNGNR